MLASATENVSGIPQSILDEKAAEQLRRKELQDSINEKIRAERQRREGEEEALPPPPAPAQVAPRERERRWGPPRGPAGVEVAAPAAKQDEAVRRVQKRDESPRRDRRDESPRRDRWDHRTRDRDAHDRDRRRDDDRGRRREDDRDRRREDDRDRRREDDRDRRREDDREAGRRRSRSPVMRGRGSPPPRRSPPREGNIPRKRSPSPGVQAVRRRTRSESPVAPSPAKRVNTGQEVDRSHSASPMEEDRRNGAAEAIPDVRENVESPDERGKSPVRPKKSKEKKHKKEKKKHKKEKKDKRDKGARSMSPDKPLQGAAVGGDEDTDPAAVEQRLRQQALQSLKHRTSAGGSPE